MFRFAYKDILFEHKLSTSGLLEEGPRCRAHPLHEIFFLIRGNMNFTVGTNTCLLKEGDLVFVWKGRAHSAVVDTTVPCEGYVLKFPGEIVPDFLREKLMAPNLVFSNSKQHVLLFRAITDYMKQYSEEELYYLLRNEIGIFLVCLAHDAQPNRNHGDLIGRIIQYIDDNLTEPLSVQSIAEYFHYSESFVKKEFKRHMGTPLMHYIRKEKIAAAHQMISGGAKKQDAANMFGFETYTTFYRTYKKYYED